MVALRKSLRRQPPQEIRRFIRAFTFSCNFTESRGALLLYLAKAPFFFVPPFTESRSNKTSVRSKSDLALFTEESILFCVNAISSPKPNREHDRRNAI